MNNLQQAMADSDKSATITFTLAIINFILIFGGCSWFGFYLTGAVVGLGTATLTVVLGWHYHMYCHNIEEWDRKHR